MNLPKVMKHKVVLLCRQYSLAKNGLNSRADGGCITIPILNKQTNNPTALFLYILAFSKG